jgi:hypothetical protein
MNNNTIQLINNTNSIKPYNSSVFTSNYIKTKNLIVEDGIYVYSNTSNINFYAGNDILPGGSGPIIQLYGKGSNGSNVGINFDTFQSLNDKNGGRYSGKNPATQILAVDNGMFSSDLVFNTSTPSSASNISTTQERMRITSYGNIIIQNNLNILGSETIN